MPIKGLRTQPIAIDEMLLVLPQAHQLASHTAVRLEQIAAEPFLMSKGGCEPLIRMLFKTAGIKPQITLEVREMTTLLSLVKEGLGVTIVPQLALPPAPAGIALVALDPPAQRQVGLILNSNRPCTPAMKVFVEAISANFQA